MGTVSQKPNRRETKQRVESSDGFFQREWSEYSQIYDTSFRWLSCPIKRFHLKLV